MGPGVKGKEKKGGLTEEEAEKELSWRLKESLIKKTWSREMKRMMLLRGKWSAV